MKKLITIATLFLLSNSAQASILGTYRSSRAVGCFDQDGVSSISITDNGQGLISVNQVIGGGTNLLLKGAENGLDYAVRSEIFRRNMHLSTDLNNLVYEEMWINSNGSYNIQKVVEFVLTGAKLSVSSDRGWHCIYTKVN